MDIFSPTIIDNAIITGSNNASLLQVSSPSAASAFFISGSGRVGIGTTSPLSTFTVEGGNINIGAGRGIGGNFVGTYTSFITYHNDGLGFLQSASFGFRGSAYMDSISYPDAFGFGTNDLRFFTSTNGIAAPSEIMRMVGSTGFVGIGETSPSAKLEIRGSGATSATTALRVENSNTSASLVVTNDIRVGINKTTPNSELDVNGTVTVTGSITSTSNITTLGSVATPTQTISGVNGWAPTSGTTNLLNIAGNLVPTATAIINSLAITSTVSQSVNPTTIIRGILVSPTFNTLGPQYRGLEWNNNQGFGLYGVGAAPNYLSGSLGIGTTSPSASLHISGASNSNLLRVGSPASDNILFVTGSGRVGVGTTTPRELLHVGGGNLSLDSTRYIDFGNGNSRINDLGLISGQGYSLRITTFGPIGTGTANSLTEKLRLTGSGSLGLGTDSPSARFHISGGFTDGDLMRVQSPTGAEYFFISASGNVGIGTATPVHNLVVNGNTGVSINAGGATFPNIHRDSADGGMLLRSWNGSTFTNNVKITPTTEVGIGTTTPTAELHISGASNITLLRVGSPAQSNILFVTGSGNVGIGTNLPSAELHISGASIDSLLRVGSPTQANTLFITGSNRVGIGTGTPRALFEVNDKIIAEAGGNVGIQTTADYWIHLSTDPGGSKYLNIDATQTSNGPQQTPVPGTFNYVAGPGTDDAVLGLPNYWMEIKLDGNIVLVPCYVPQ